MEQSELIKQKKRKSRSLKIKAGVVLIVLVLFAVWFFFIRQKNGLDFELSSISKGTIESVVSATGSLAAVTTVDVGSQVSGIIEEVTVDYNDRVHMGQILARIDTSLYNTQLEKAQAQLSSAQSQLEVAQADLMKAQQGVQNAQAGIFQAEAGLERARADLENARAQLYTSQANLKRAEAQMANDRIEYERAEQLLAKEFISRSDRDKYYTAHRVSEANFHSSKSGVSSSEASVKAATSNIAAAQANVKAAIANRDQAISTVDAAAARVQASTSAIQQAQSDISQVQVNLERCIIRSPIDGIVIDRKVEPGQTVAASFQAPVLFVLAKNLKHMEVKAAVDEADIGKVREKQEVSFTVDAFPDDRFKGSIFQVRTRPNVEQNVVTYDVIIRTDNEEMKLKPGMTANIDITVEVKNDIIRIPNAALRFRPERVAGFPMPDAEKNDKDKKGDKDGKAGKEGEKSEDRRDDKSGKKEDGKSEDGKGKKGKRGASPAPGEKKFGRGDREKGGDRKDRDLSPVWVLEDNKPRKYMVKTGIMDNNFTEMVSGDLKDSMEAIIDASAAKDRKKNSTPRPGQGGPGGGPGRGGGGGGSRNVRVRL